MCGHPRDLGAALEAERFEHLRDVVADRAGGQAQLLADLLVRQSDADEFEHPALLGGELDEQVLVLPAGGQPIQQAHHVDGTEQPLTACHGADGVRQLFRGVPLLQVRRGAHQRGGEHPALLRVARQEDARRRGRQREDLPGALHAVPVGQVDVQHHHVGSALAHTSQGRGRGMGLAHYLAVAVRPCQQVTQRHPRRLVVVHEDHPCHHWHPLSKAQGTPFGGRVDPTRLVTERGVAGT